MASISTSSTQCRSQRKAQVLACVSGRIGAELLPLLSNNSDIDLRALSCEASAPESILHRVPAYSNTSIGQGASSTQRVNFSVQLAKWADVLFVQADPACLTQLLKGQVSDILSTIVRSWDVSKHIILLPDFSNSAWKHPVTARQLKKLKRDFPWVRLLRPALWDVNGDIRATPKRTYEWEGPQPIAGVIAEEVTLILSEANHLPIHAPKHLKSLTTLRPPITQPKHSLPPEIWTVVFEYLGDWELATALGVYHQIPTPSEWQSLLPDSDPAKPLTLEYMILTRPLPAIRSYFTTPRHPITLSSLSIKLIFKFSLTRLLTYLSLEQKDIFWNSFAPTVIPHAASAIHNKPSILQWWHTSPAVLQKNYGTEAIDGASRAGFVPVLDWWLNSGLPLYYTEKALEYASAKGQIAVLDWWKTASASRSRKPSTSSNSDSSTENDNNKNATTSISTSTSTDLPLKVGKSILFAAQSGRADAIRWWDASGLPYAHEDNVAKLASTHGHVDVLDVWLHLKGSKMIFDHLVLVGATRNGHAHVLEWWKRRCRGQGQGQHQHQHQLVVEYKTCDIEEAMEDAVGGGGGGGEGEQNVREWWERNGLNLGVGTGEWMKVKTL